MGNKTKEQKVIDNITSPVVLDLAVDIKMPKLTQVTEREHKCTCCGKSWSTQKGHFSKSYSALYQSNNGYINICNDCRDEYYYRLVDLYSGNEAHAVRHICQQFDIIFNTGALAASRQISANRSRFSTYLSKKNLGQVTAIGSTYIDGIKYDYSMQQNEIIESKEQIKHGESSISQSAVDRWGVGFSEADYRNLDEHYRMLKKNNPNAESNQDIFIKSLCNINMLMIRALKENNSDRYAKLVEQYSKTFKQAGLRTAEERDNSSDECLGVTLAAIAQYTPEEYYKDKQLYKDFDGIGDYFDRFVKRPLKNLMMGTNERDEEYRVKEDSDLDE